MLTVKFEKDMFLSIIIDDDDRDFHISHRSSADYLLQALLALVSTHFGKAQTEAI